MDLIKILFDSNWNIQINFNKWILLSIVVALVIWFIVTRFFVRFFGRSFEINEAEIGIGNNKLKIKLNYEDIQIAYKLWVEISTRKIGLPIDFENDVLIEIYNSWYEFFKITRELIKGVPVSKIRKYNSTRKLIDIMVAVLNEEMRPHLTLWQARFRRWYSIESEKNKNTCPQDIQKNFPEYKLLIKDMNDTNQKLIKYREILKEIALED